MTKHRVTQNYTANIVKASAGIFIDSKGYGYVLTGIEEEIKKTGNYYNDVYRRYWLLDYYETSFTSMKEVYDKTARIQNSYDICYIKTNSHHLASYLQDLVRSTETMEVLPEEAITLIKSLINDKKLEIRDSSAAIKSKLEEYDINEPNHLLNALYLSVNCELNSVFLSKEFADLPTIDEQILYEEMPLNDLMKLAFQNPDSHLNETARAIFRKRWAEKTRLEMEELRKLPDFKY